MRKENIDGASNGISMKLRLCHSLVRFVLYWASQIQRKNIYVTYCCQRQYCTSSPGQIPFGRECDATEDDHSFKSSLTKSFLPVFWPDSLSQIFTTQASSSKIRIYMQRSCCHPLSTKVLLKFAVIPRYEGSDEESCISPADPSYLGMTKYYKTSITILLAIIW